MILRFEKLSRDKIFREEKSAVTVFLAQILTRKENNVREQLRQWYRQTNQPICYLLIAIAINLETFKVKQKSQIIPHKYNAQVRR
jgi:hypothetical protein